MGDPFSARVAASTSRQATAMAGVGQGRRALMPGNAGGAKGPDCLLAGREHGRTIPLCDIGQSLRNMPEVNFAPLPGG